MKKQRRYKYKVVRAIDEKSCIIPANSEYALVYTKGKIVKAPLDTLGIMVFETKKNAESFRAMATDQKIKRVIPIGRGLRPKLVAWTVSDHSLKDFYSGGYDDIQRITTRIPPKGTICYPAVEVID